MADEKHKAMGMPTVNITPFLQPNMLNLNQ
jgi:hypothetical protein